MKIRTAFFIVLFGIPLQLSALEKPEITYQVFQFPANQIPRIDGQTDDWAIVPSTYVIGSDQLLGSKDANARGKVRSIEANVRVGWVKGLNRLYFLYEAEDDYWDFALPGLHNDTFEVVVDADASGGPLIDKGHKEFWTAERVGESAAASEDRRRLAAPSRMVNGKHSGK